MPSHDKRMAAEAMHTAKPIIPTAAQSQQQLGESSAIANTMHHSPIKAKDVTPYLLGRIVELTGERSLAANVALVRNNAGVAAGIANALTA